MNRFKIRISQIYEFVSLKYSFASLKKDTVHSIDNITTGNAAIIVTDCML